MKKILILLNILIFNSCNISDNNYQNVTSSKNDINFYELVEVQFQDGSFKGSISIPNFLEKLKPVGENIFQYEYFDDVSGYTIAIDKLKSRNTEKLSDKEYLDITNDTFKNKWKGDLSRIEKLLPPIMKNVKVITLQSNLIIHDKYFLKRVSYYQDKRLDGTVLEDVNCINFHFVTLQNKTRYNFNINYYGDDKSVSDVVGLFNTIGGSIKFN
ncbi:MAG: hypothetical protein MUQ70_04895 [Flavobacteriaceae bacterium]|nr:hypothetical protein [Flavobacteriaceae bacterium]